MELGPKNQNRDGFFGPNSIGSVYGPSGLDVWHAVLEGISGCLSLLIFLLHLIADSNHVLTDHTCSRLEGLRVEGLGV